MPRRFAGRLVRQARLAAGLRPDELARRIDRSPFTVDDYENGRARPPADVLGALADALSVPIDALYAPDPAAGDVPMTSGAATPTRTSPGDPHGNHLPVRTDL